MPGQCPEFKSGKTSIRQLYFFQLEQSAAVGSVRNEGCEGLAVEFSQSLPSGCNHTQVCCKHCEPFPFLMSQSLEKRGKKNMHTSAAWSLKS